MDTDSAKQPGSASPEEAEGSAHPPCCGSRFFEICVKGHLGCQWSEWLEGLDMTFLDTGETILSGIIPDQAALMGILDKLNRLNLCLLSVVARRPGAGDSSQSTTSQEA